jgi:hypothetical protein
MLHQQTTDAMKKRTYMRVCLLADRRGNEDAQCFTAGNQKNKKAEAVHFCFDTI